MTLYNVLIPTLTRVPSGRDRKETRKSASFKKDKRRKHRHWQVAAIYQDGERFARLYIDRDRAARFAERRKKFPVVKMVRATQLS
jgi:hypothetical protein